MREDQEATDVPPSDLELVAQLRGGESTGAYEELYRRHAGAVRRYALSCCRDDHTAEDLTNEVFAATLQAVRGGAGPDTAVRAYLLTTVRRVAAAWGRTTRREHLVEDFAVFATSSAAASVAAEDDTLGLGADVRAMQEAEESLAVRAFRSLPERWQTVLWHTTVEEESPSEVAPLLGLTANATAVLAHRAREGLRQAYLQAHVSTSLTTGGECARYADRLGAYARGSLRARAERGMRRHLDGCARCRMAAREVADVNSRLRGLLPVAVIGWFAADWSLKAASGLAAGAAGAAGAAAVSAGAGAGADVGAGTGAGAGAGSGTGSAGSGGGGAGAAGSGSGSGGAAGSGTAGSGASGSGTAGSGTSGSGTSGSGAAGSGAAGSGTSGSGVAAQGLGLAAKVALVAGTVATVGAVIAYTLAAGTSAPPEKPLAKDTVAPALPTPRAPKATPRLTASAGPTAPPALMAKPVAGSSSAHASTGTSAGASPSAAGPSASRTPVASASSSASAAAGSGSESRPTAHAPTAHPSSPTSNTSSTSNTSDTSDTSKPTPKPTPTHKPDPTPDPEPKPTHKPRPPAVFPLNRLEYSGFGDGSQPEVRFGASSWLWQRYGGVRIGGTAYRHGVTVHAASSVTIDLNRSCTSYDAMAGLDDMSFGLGTVAFSVYADGTRLWSSGPVRAGQAAVPVHVPLTGRKTLRLVVQPVSAWDRVAVPDWALARISCG
ncbi:sigma-70 family RNA polymerase sigma factor [Streptomyces abikoensis]|uniref:sigma-70 family RNA polymerase sigma factor n=1 Tax=Streptomyces abikoensis TaxID=97398 RepID=UPI00371DA51B